MGFQSCLEYGLQRHSKEADSVACWVVTIADHHLSNEAPVEAHVFTCGGAWAGVQKMYDVAIQSKALQVLKWPSPSGCC